MLASQNIIVNIDGVLIHKVIINVIENVSTIIETNTNLRT